MSRSPKTIASVALLASSCGFAAAVSFLSCTAEQKGALKDASDIVHVLCQIAPVISPEAKEVCVTEGELEKAILDIVSARKATAGASSAAPAQGSLVVKLAKPVGSR